MNFKFTNLSNIDSILIQFCDEIDLLDLIDLISNFNFNEDCLSIMIES